MAFLFGQQDTGHPKQVGTTCKRSFEKSIKNQACRDGEEEKGVSYFYG